jgi:hypothetical protein
MIPKRFLKDIYPRRYPMKRLLLLIILAAAMIVVPGCKDKSGSTIESIDELISDDLDGSTLDREKALSAEQAPAPASGITRDTKAGVGGGDVLAQSPASDVTAIPSSRMVIKTASLSIRVKDVDAMYNRAIQLVEEGGGYVQSGVLYESDGARADITIKVHPKGFNSMISKLEELGTVEYKQISGEDVTEEYFDLQAELATQQALKDRLFDLLKKAKNVEEAIYVEQELQRVDYNVNRIKGRMKYLEQMTAESTITLSIYSESPTSKTPFIVWQRIGDGFKTAARVLVVFFFVLLQVLVVVIPIGGLVLLIVWLVIRTIRKRKEKRKK